MRSPNKPVVEHAPRERAGRWSRYPIALVLRRYPGLLGIPLVFFIATTLDSAISSGPILCIFRLGSGLPCAGCGMTRGFIAIGHGYFATALHYNLFAPVAFAWLVGWWFMAVTRLWRGARPWAHPSALIKGALIVLIGYWMVRAAWFVSQPGAWQDMRDTSPLLRLLSWLFT